MFKVLISDNVAQECVSILESAEGIEVDFNTKLTPDELKSVIGQYDALIVRSATKVRGEVIANAAKLKVIGRAGAGVDNIDVKAATDKGIVVMNTPGGNTISTAEHTFSLIMALSRNIPQADRSLKEGRWDRKKYSGVELRGKVLGVIGLGNIGFVLAKRAIAFEMKVIGHDPFISKDMAESIGVELATLEEIWSCADYITVHTPLNDSTRHMINADTLAKCKDGVRIINCARGGIVDEQALLDAIESGKVAGAALDVYETEPPENNRLVMHEKVVSTPHLGASTTEAQDIVAVMVAGQVRDYLVSGEVKNAVNIPSMASETYMKMQPFMRLGEKVGALVGYIGEGQLNGVDIVYYGDAHNFNVWPITSSILQGLFTRGYAEGVNLVNAKNTAEKLGIKVQEVKSSEEKDYRNCINVTAYTSKGEINVEGAIFGKNTLRVVNLNGYNLDFPPDGVLLICGNTDRPGIIGKIGTVLGSRGINIAHMTWARKSQAGDAIVVLNTDQEMDRDVITAVKGIQGITWAKSIVL